MAESRLVNTIARERVEDLAERHSEPAWLKESRLSAWEAYLQTPLPTARNEEWRRTEIGSLDLSSLTTLDFNPSPASAGRRPGWFESIARNFDRTAGVFVHTSQNGGHLLLSEELASKGVIFVDLEDAIVRHADLIRPYLEGKATPLDGKFGLMNRALFNCGLFLYVPAGVEISEPLLSGIGFGRQEPGTMGGAIFPRIFLIAEANSKVNLVQVLGADSGITTSAPGEEQNYSQSDSLCAGLVDIHVGPGAQVSYLELQTFGPDVFSVNRTRSEVLADGSLTSLAVALGGRQTKANIATLLNEPGATSEVLGIVLGSGREHYSYNTIQEHNAPDTRSNINFRVALDDSALSVYLGTISVAKAAQRTDAYQSNKNLLLGSEARADSIPKLEILADDVKCSHGATVGPVDKDQIFYLMSRGLPLKQAEELIVLGFFRQVVEQFRQPYAISCLEELIARKIYGLKEVPS